MSDDRNSYKGQTIGLEFYDHDVSGFISSVDQVIIFQDKEVCFSTTTISSPSPGTWSISVNTNSIKYTGTYNDRWIINGGTGWVEKSLTISDAASTVARSKGNYIYFAKDIYFDTTPDGDLYRIYDNTAIAAKMEAVCMSVKGSLYNEPTYGSNLYSYLFSSNPNIKDSIKLELQTQLQIQVPQIKISAIDVVQTETNMYSVSINFYNITSSNPSELLNLVNLVSVEQLL